MASVSRLRASCPATALPPPCPGHGVPQRERAGQGGDFLSSAGPFGSDLVLQQERWECGNQSAGCGPDRDTEPPLGQAGAFSQLLGWPPSRRDSGIPQVKTAAQNLK